VMDVYEWALKQDLALMFTSEYLRVMQGYMAAKTAVSGTRRFTVTQYGDCLTMRFPAGTSAPDLVRSENVIGYQRSPQGLFISLLSGSSRAVIVLGDENSRPAGAYLRKATGFVTRFQAGKQGIVMEYRGFGGGHLEIGGLEAGKTYLVSGSGMGGGREIKANGQGVLDLRGVKSGVLEMKRR
jgi:polysaccharide biosynthesis protein PelA